MKDRSAEITLVLRFDKHLDEDLETIVREMLSCDGVIEVREYNRVGETGTIDLPHVWLPTSPETVPALRPTDEVAAAVAAIAARTAPSSTTTPPAKPKRPITGFFRRK